MRSQDPDGEKDGEKPETERRPLNQKSPLDGILEDPKASDRGVASLDKALWDQSRKKSEVERNAEKP